MNRPKPHTMTKTANYIIHKYRRGANRIVFEICQQPDNVENIESNDSNTDYDSDLSSEDVAEANIVD